MIIGKGLGLKKYELVFDSLPPAFHGKRFLFLSDLHGKSYGRENEHLLTLIHEMKPDFILVGGDMVVGGVREDGTPNRYSEDSVKVSLSLLKRLRTEFPIFHAYGNHEEKLEKNLLMEYNKSLENLGVNLLDNGKAMLFVSEDAISLYGLSLGRHYYPKLKRKKLRSEDIRDRIGESDDFSILLAHSPFYFEAYRNWGAKLTLAGHLHGGIMRLPLLGGVLGPDLLPFPKYSGGLYTEEGHQMIVSCGLGSHTIDLRVFNPPELTVIDFLVGGMKNGD